MVNGKSILFAMFTVIIDDEYIRVHQQCPGNRLYSAGGATGGYWMLVALSKVH